MMVIHNLQQRQQQQQHRSDQSSDRYRGKRRSGYPGQQKSGRSAGSALTAGE